MELDRWGNQIHNYMNMQKQQQRKRNPRVGQWAIEAPVNSRVVLTDRASDKID